MGLAGAGWTFVVTGGCAAGGRLRGDCERVRSVRADALARGAAFVVASVP